MIEAEINSCSLMSAHSWVDRTIALPKHQELGSRLPVNVEYPALGQKQT